MTYDNQEQVAKWIEQHYNYKKNRMDFLANKDRPAESRQVCAVLFLYKKLKKECKSERYLFHAASEYLDVGTFDMFEDFTEEEVKEALCYNIEIADDGDGFQIYASM